MLRLYARGSKGLINFIADCTITGGTRNVIAANSSHDFQYCRGDDWRLHQLLRLRYQTQTTPAAVGMALPQAPLAEPGINPEPLANPRN